jgi:hypothetical protein
MLSIRLWGGRKSTPSRHQTMIRLPPRLELVLLGHSKRNSEEDNNAVGDLNGMEEADPGMDEARKKCRWVSSILY